MKEGIVRFAKIVKRIFIAYSAVVLTAFMVCAVFAFNKVFAFYFITPALLIMWLTAYGFYTMKVSLGAVLGIELTDEVIVLKTKRKSYTYDRARGCEKVKVCKNKFIGTFSNQTSRDKFIFYRRVLFTKYSEEQFTRADVALFYPAILHENSVQN